ncbi:MAG: TIGR00374 family protein, partial [Flavobacteriales bacterium]
VFFALPETANVPLAGVLAAFVVGGLSIVLVQGGIGVYPLFVAVVLELYGLSETSGVTLGWIIWSGQTAMLLFWGAISLIAMPLTNTSSLKPE